MAKVQADTENAATVWWDALGTANPELWDRLANPEGEFVEVTAEELKFLQSLPGWYGGPAYAPHPLMICE